MFQSPFSELVRKVWPEKVLIPKKVADFEREYQNDYLSKF
jgi:hypothetical protein